MYLRFDIWADGQLVYRDLPQEIVHKIVDIIARRNYRGFSEMVIVKHGKQP